MAQGAVNSHYGELRDLMFRVVPAWQPAFDGFTHMHVAPAREAILRGALQHRDIERFDFNSLLQPRTPFQSPKLFGLTIVSNPHMPKYLALVMDRTGLRTQWLDFRKQPRSPDMSQMLDDLRRHDGMERP